jgi:serine/threonine protein kinase
VFDGLTILWPPCTPTHAAPEVFTSSIIEYKSSVDVYSFAIIMWELATRDRPWSEFDHLGYTAFRSALGTALLAGRRPRLPGTFDIERPVFASVLRKAWSTDPTMRPTFDTIFELLTQGGGETLAPPGASTVATGGALLEPLLPP